MSTVSRHAAVALKGNKFLGQYWGSLVMAISGRPGHRGFDLSLSLVPFERDPERDARVVEFQRMTPQERMQEMLDRRNNE